MTVYFAKPEGEAIVKIGYTGDRVATRIVHIQSVSKKKLILLGFISGDREKEREVHVLFEQYRIKGEWFRIAGALADFLADLPPVDPVFLPLVYDWNPKDLQPPIQRNGRPAKMTPEKVKQGLALLKSGKSVATVALKLKVSKPSIYNYFNIKHRGGKVTVTLKRK